MVPWCCLALLAFIPATWSANAGVKVKLTEKGLEYGKQIAMLSLQEKLKTIKVPDISGTVKMSPVGKIQYSLTNMQIVKLGLPKSAMGLVPESGVSLAVTNAFIILHGNWKVKYFRFIKDSGSFDLTMTGLTITTSVSITSDETGRPTLSTLDCESTIGGATIKFRGGASWLYNLFSTVLDKVLRGALQKEICPLVGDTISDMNPRLKTLNVVAKVDKDAEIEYSMVSSPTVSNISIDLSLKGEFYNIGKHVEPPFVPTPFSLLPQINSMLYIGISAFTINSAGFVYHRAGALSVNITDDMIPPASPIRLNTRTFGAFIPQIAKRFPGLTMKLLVSTVKEPAITFNPDTVTIEAVGTVTAYAILLNGSLTPLFILNMDGSVSTKVYVSGVKLVGAVTLNQMKMTLGTSYVGDFQVKSLDNIFSMVLKVAVIPKVNARLAAGYPLPSIGKMDLVNTQLQVLKDYMLIGTDVQFSG